MSSAPRKRPTKDEADQKEPPSEQAAKKPREYNSQFTYFSLARNFQLADFITILNCACGFNSILSSISFVLLLQTHKGDGHLGLPSITTMTYQEIALLRWAFGLPFLGCFFDFLDGKVARLTKNGPTMLGQELDSLSDLISFGVAPAVLGWVAGLKTSTDCLILTLFVCAGLARLARFNVTTHTVVQDETGKAKYFEGLPIPTSLTLVSFMWSWWELDLFRGTLPGGIVTLWGNRDAHLWSFAYLGWAFAMISQNLRVPKL
ncbi:CDP-diacylglycerol-serine O-phosphatidyltransferase [Kappamyces sp. JEL0829]|nr:CDP-diacylglycerol-serine O-phosphatidyltransferase [Kappamyces sp. JEL0829]